jgi:hypothetical protein
LVFNFPKFLQHPAFHSGAIKIINISFYKNRQFLNKSKRYTMLKDAPPWTVQMGIDTDPLLIHLMSQQVPTVMQPRSVEAIT